MLERAQSRPVRVQSVFRGKQKKSRAPSPLVLWRRFDTRTAGRPRCRPAAAAAAATRVPYVRLFARTQARGTPVERTPKSERALRTRVSRQLFFLSRFFLPLFTSLFLLLLFTAAYPYLIAAARQHAFSADNYSAYPARSSGISLPVDTAAAAAFRADIRPTTATDFRFPNNSIYLTYISLRTPRVAARTRGDFVSSDVRSVPPPAIEFYCSFLLAINLCMCGNFFLHDHFARNWVNYKNIYSARGYISPCHLPAFLIVGRRYRKNK